MSHDDFAFEPIPGLPGRPPKGEDILWQGRPDALALAREALLHNWVIGYFVLLAVWRVLATSADYPIGVALLSGLPFLGLGAIVAGLLYAFAWAQARATVYTITTARVAMRIGAALSVTLNLPYNWIGSADLDLRKSGTGTIALKTLGETRISYLVCWPHVRPWRMARTQPALRCIPDAARVSKLLSDAAESRLAAPQLTRRPAEAAEPADTPGALPAE
ncbi:MAG: photosynthetic complex putative assembly protein PuhB [Pseudomonadota bacterium]